MIRLPAKKNKKPEAEFKRAAVQFLKIRYGRHFFRLAIAGGPYQRAGSPDEVYSIRGQFVAIEYKAPGGRIGPKQAELIQEIRESGGRAGVVSSWQELEILLAGIEPVQKGMIG